MKKVEKIYKCGCHAEGFTMHTWPDEKMVVLNIWTMGYTNVGQMSWGERFKEIWRVLTQGRSHLGEVLLDYQTANELADDIKKDIQSCNTSE